MFLKSNINVPLIEYTRIYKACAIVDTNAEAKYGLEYYQTKFGFNEFKKALQVLMK